MRCGSLRESGEPSLTSKRGSTRSGGGKGKPGSWAEEGAPLRGEKANSEAELSKVVEVESTAETGVDNVIEVVTEGMTGAEGNANVWGTAKRAGDCEVEAEVVEDCVESS